MNRIFGINSDGVRSTWMPSTHIPVQDHASRLMFHGPTRKLIAYEADAEGIDMPRTDQQFFDRCKAALAAGHWIDSPLNAATYLGEWAKTARVSPSTIAASAATVSRATPAKPGQTQIVQEWLLTQDAQALSDRAWAATMALAKGA